MHVTKTRLALIISVILAVCGMLSGCTGFDEANKENASKEIDRSEEIKELLLPENIDTVFDMVVMEDGILRLVATIGNEVAIYDSGDKGNTWEEAYNSTDLFEKAENEKVGAYASKSNEIFWKSLEYNEDGGVEGAKYYYMKESKIVPVNLKLPEIDKAKREHNEEFEWLPESAVNYILNTEFSDDGNLLAMDENFDLHYINIENGEINKSYENNHGYILGCSQYNDMILMATNHEILSWDMNTGEENEDDELIDRLNNTYVKESIPSFESNIVLKHEREQLYVFNSFGLFRNAENGVEQVCDLKGEGAGELLQQYILDAEVYNKDLYLIAINMQSNQYSMYWMDTTEKDEESVKEELTIYSLYNNQNVELAINAFEIEYPNIKVNYKVGISDGNIATETDVIKNLNTEIMTNKGPDILVLDDLPYTSYMEKGLLMDLAETIKADKYFANVVEQFKSSEDEILAVPSRIVLLALEGEVGLGESSDSISAIEEYIKKVDNQMNYSEEEFMQMMEFLYSSYVEPMIGTDTEIEEKLLTEYISCIRTLYSKCGYPELSDSWRNNSAEKNGVYVTVNYFNWVADDRAITFDYVDFVKLIPILNEITNADESKEYCLLSDNSEKVYIPAGILGISAASKKGELAKKFINFTMSKKVQSNDNITGFPNNKEALKVCLQDDRHNVYTNIDETTGFQIHPYTESEADKFVSHFEELNKPILRDSYIKKVILESAGNSLAGDIAVSSVVSEIMEKINIYNQE
ncbi:hypothetical protein M2454_001189 [Aequitasia blattaphilus]|uniref:ABC transporter substrate-binding protein n=1 Tax=Aequitasia blattaphilus TaxID=2949332 RepID=A0ABT1E6J1_9FIRM|nr:ABC transporter substrate-binding protein [Aequitasia blattaphilus]MCP1101453.1 ABC transporter substrate-binding protein [Aequitasia blattaphilus]MCR8614093.1 ABC transporter substrate-binding protein [Aequitasia blattaphilus]